MKTFIAAIDSPGGHMIFCLVLVAGGIATSAFGLDLSNDALIMFALGVLGRSMLGQNGKGPMPPPLPPTP